VYLCHVQKVGDIQGNQMNLLSLIIYEYEIQTANQSHKCIAKFRYLTIQNYIQNEIKSSLTSGTDWWHAVMYLLSPFLSTNVDIKVCRTAFCLLLYMSVQLIDNNRLISYWGSVQERGAEEDIWVWEGWGTRTVEKTT